jgi:hypothetical protein
MRVTRERPPTNVFKMADAISRMSHNQQEKQLIEENILFLKYQAGTNRKGYMTLLYLKWLTNIGV